MERRRAFADVLYIEALRLLQTRGIAALRPPLFAAPEAVAGTERTEAAILREVNLVDYVQGMSEKEAIRITQFARSAVPSGLSTTEAFRVGRVQLASLLLAASLFGSTLANDDVARDLAWSSDDIFVVAAARIGTLIELPPESEDPFERYASLREVSPQLQAAAASREARRDVSSSKLKSLPKKLDEPLLALTIGDYIGLLGESAAMGYALQAATDTFRGVTDPAQDRPS